MKNTETKMINITFWSLIIGIPLFVLFYLINRNFTLNTKWEKHYNEYNRYYKKLSELQENDIIRIGEEYKVIKISNGNENDLKRKSLLLTNNRGALLINFDNSLPKDPLFSIGDNFKEMNITSMDINTACKITLNFKEHDIEVKDLNGRQMAKHMEGMADIGNVFKEIMEQGTYPICSQLSQNKFNFEIIDLE